MKLCIHTFIHFILIYINSDPGRTNICLASFFCAYHQAEGYLGEELAIIRDISFEFSEIGETAALKLQSWFSSFSGAHKNSPYVL